MQKKKPTPEKTPAPKGAEAKLSSYQKFEPVRIHRRDIKAAPYNPRHIDAFTAKKLRDVLARVGLVQPLIWNARSGHLVGGHQRLEQIDALDAHDGGTGNFLMDVAKVDVTDKRERELNVILNNASLQGTFDVDLLGAMFEAGDLNPEHVGFETIELQDLFADTDYSTLFSPPPPAETAELEAMRDAPNGRLENGEAIRDPERYEAIKAEHLKVRAKMAEQDKERDTEYMVVVVCADRAQREGLMVALGKEADDKYIDARELAHKLGLNLEP